MLLGLRIASSVIMAPAALWVVWQGGVFFTLLVGLCGVLMLWEWNRMCRQRFDLWAALGAGAALMAALMAARGPIGGVALIGTAAVVIATLGSSGWLALGLVYVGMPIISMGWMRAGVGAVSVAWLLGVVWATDVGGYAFGRIFGGPQLARRVSPRKTWAGFAGGITCAVAVGAALGTLFGSRGDCLSSPAFAAGLSVVAQLGDLFESWIKRHFGFKDSSRVIPGHGGILDRLDGLAATAPVMALALLASRGDGG